jgi:hypothetical protein
MAITRAEFLRLTVGTLVATPLIGSRHRADLSARGVAAQPADADRATRVARVLEEYDAQGIHRTGTAVDNRSADWLVDLARASGANARRDTFKLGRVDLRSAYIEAEGRRAEGLPLFDGTFTGPQGVVGRVAPPEHGQPIALVVLDNAGISSEGRILEALRRSNKHQAIVAVTAGTRPGLTPTNADRFATPYGLPVLQVDTDDHLWLRDLTARGVEARLVADAARTPAEASNVTATVAGRNPNLPPLVVMTPRSGWWHCAAERGGGIACWLESLRAVAAAKPPRTVMAIASSGHELGHFGLDAFLESRRDLVKSAAAWIHLGANIGARGGVPRLQASDDRIEGWASDALARAGAEVKQRVPRGTRPGGEARNIHDGGGRYLSLLGSSPFFHHIDDRWPAAVEIAAVVRFSEAISNLAVRLAGDSI